ncbi:MAG: hypothetical protein ACI4GB_05740 [Acutalibacteraceae bacterium]
MDKREIAKKKKRAVKAVKRVGKGNIKSDVQGSYTGVPENPADRPIQDVDDL